jgi:N-acetylmuramoyl-L-alanine amidase
MTAQQLESELSERAPEQRPRSVYLKVIEAYQRVYLVTPHTGYADNALMAIARLYEEIKETRLALRALNFLLREYPGTPFRDAAERDIARLQGTPETGSGAVENIRFWENPKSIRIVVDLTGTVTFIQGEAKAPERVFFDIAPARLNSMLLGKQWIVSSPLLGQIRVGQYDTTTVRLVLDVGRFDRIDSFVLRNPERLVIDVFGPGTAAASAAERPATSETAATDATTTSSKPEAPEVKILAPAKPTNRGDHSLIRSLGLKLSRVVIDAGHGGYDTGSIGPTGYTEKELVLDVSHRLKQLIEARLQAEVVLTRTDDGFIPLEERTAIANRQEADLFISVHANSSRIRSVRGVETFILNFTSSREAIETATRENAASGSSIHKLQDLVKKIMLQDKVDESRELAEHLQRAMARRKGAGANRGVKQAPLVVLIGASMPSVLAEICFISNPEEEKLIKTPSYRQAIAESLFDGVRSYAESLSSVKAAGNKQ